jgi:hypothetical protein
MLLESGGFRQDRQEDESVTASDGPESSIIGA